MKKFVIITSFLILSNSHLISQNLNKYSNWELKQYAADAELKKNFVIEKKYYSELAKRKKNDFAIINKLAQLQFETRDYENAKNNFFKVYKAGGKIAEKAWYNYAAILKMQGNYKSAEDIFKEILKTCKDKDDLELKYLTKMQIDGINLENSDSNIFIIHLDKTINSPHLETSPIIINDTAFVYASYYIDSIKIISGNKDSLGPETHFYLATKQNNKWTGHQKANLPFYNLENKSTANGAFSLDHKRFYFTIREFNKQGILLSHLYYTKIENEVWSEPIKIENDVNSEFSNSTQPTVGYSFNSSQEIIYFISDRPDGWGGFDIWFTVYDIIYDKFSEPVNAGGFINSFADEMTPFYDAKDKKMYFSSNGYPSLGGFDIFYSIGEVTSWTQAVNLGKPINSTYDDFYFTQLPNKKTGLLISNRDEALDWGNKNCCFDIFFFDQFSNKHVLVTGNLYATNIPTSAFMQKELLNDTVNENQKIEKNLNNVVVSLQVKNNSDNKYFTIFKDTTDANGNFNFSVSPGQDYNISINANGYLFNNYSFSINNPIPDSINVGKIETEPIPQKNIVLRNILFNYNSADLTDNSKLYLDTLVIPVLKKYNNTVIEIGAHTDSKGSNEYNLRLSQERAQTVLDYISIQGIAKNRLKAVGYGETQPLENEKNPDGTENIQAQSLNRRVEFKILGLNNQL